MACAREWLDVEAGCVKFYLVGRSSEKLACCTEDLLARGASVVYSATLDIADIASYAEVFEKACDVLKRIDVALIAHGSLPTQLDCEQSVCLTANEFLVNATSVICCLTALGGLMDKKSMKSSRIAVITSVAGDRGRESNYLYGSAKAAVSTFCDGLRIRLCRSDISVTDIRPGMVDTVMTKGLDLPQKLLATTDHVARDIVKAIKVRKSVVYTPKYWSLIMLVIRLIPRFLFRRINL